MFQTFSFALLYGFGMTYISDSCWYELMLQRFGFKFINIICDFVANSYLVSPRTHHQQQQQQQQVYFKLSIVYKSCAPINKPMSPSSKRHGVLNWTSGLCSGRAWWPLAPNFCPWATRKSHIFHTNHMLGTLDFTVSEHWAPFKFP